MFINLAQTDEREKVRETYTRMKTDSDLEFWIGNPSVDLISGVLHFYPYVLSSKKSDVKDEIRSNILSIVSIPNSKEVTELYELFKGFHNDIQVMRVLRTSYTYNYAIIIKFNTAETAHNFYARYNNKRFNSIENEVCIIREIERVEMKTEKLEQSTDVLPSLKETRSTESTSEDVFSLALEKDAKDTQDSKKEWQRITAYENQYHCPICLDPILEPQKADRISPLSKKPSKLGSDNHPEIVDYITPLISILCGHFFHVPCLEKWNDAKCPVCRYYQHPLQSSKCDFCGSSECLWMCIICGFIACAPNGPINSHIKDHYDMTKHIYAVEVETKGVFDFSKNTLVQRLLQNMRDGKIIQHEGTPTSNDKMSQNEELEKRLDTVIYEYNLLLSSQYQSQKEYYQDQLNQASKEHEQKIKKQEDEIRQLEEDKKHLLEESKSVDNEFQDKRNEFFTLKELFLQLDGEKKELERKNKELCSQQDSLVNKHKNTEHNQMELLNSLREEIAAMTIQIKDMEAHIATKDKLQKAFLKEGLDTENSHILVSSKPSKGKKKK